MAHQDGKSPAPVPTVDFYGDTSAWPMSELVHSERLVKRSELHDWRIRPHRHNNLTQLFLVLEGSGKARLDSAWHDVASPCLLIVPERAVHEFEWLESSDGLVLSIRSNLVSALAQHIEPLGAIFGRAAMLNITESLPLITELFTAIHDECTALRPLKDVSLDSLIRVLAIWLARQTGTQAPAGALPGRAGKHYANFTRLLDEYHKSHWSVARYADALGITPSHLNAICQQLAICGGNSRTRAWQLTGNPWAEDPGCYLSDIEIGVTDMPDRVELTPYRKGEEAGKLVPG